MTKQSDNSPGLPKKILSSKVVRVAVAGIGVAAGAAVVHFVGKVLPHPLPAIGETLAWGATGAAVGGLFGMATEDGGDLMGGLSIMFGVFLGGAAGLIAGAASWSVIPSAAPVIGSALAIGCGGVFGGFMTSSLYEEYVVN